MQKLTFETAIDAPRAQVWQTMLGDETYRQWTSAFAEGSQFEGSWVEGSDIKFHDGSGQGMLAKVTASREPEYVEVEHFGMLADGVVLTEGPALDDWVPAIEAYEFIDENGSTLLRVTMETNEKHAAMFSEMWPKALERLKTLCEN